MSIGTEILHDEPGNPAMVKKKKKKWLRKAKSMLIPTVDILQIRKFFLTAKLNLFPFMQRIQFLPADPSYTFHLTDIYIIKIPML